MHRTNADGHVANMWSPGDPGAGQEATQIDATYMNDLQENICKAIEAAGIVLIAGDYDQLTHAITKLHGKQAFTSSGSFTVPAGVTKIYISGCGGGGGGGGAGGSTSTPNSAGGGGGGGSGQAIIQVPYVVTPGQVISVTIAAGGTAGAGAASGGTGGNAGNGGSTVVGALVTLAGGSGGTGGGNASPPSGGNGGSGYPQGSYGGDGPAPYGGAGAGGPFGGGGGSARAASSDSYSGLSPSGCGTGGGGGGACYILAHTGAAGAPGSSGLVIIEW